MSKAMMRIGVGSSFQDAVVVSMFSSIYYYYFCFEIE